MANLESLLSELQGNQNDTSWYQRVPYSIGKGAAKGTAGIGDILNMLGIPGEALASYLGEKTGLPFKETFSDPYKFAGAQEAQEKIFDPLEKKLPAGIGTPQGSIERMISGMSEDTPFYALSAATGGLPGLVAQGLSSARRAGGSELGKQIGLGETGQALMGAGADLGYSALKGGLRPKAIKAQAKQAAKPLYEKARSVGIGKPDTSDVISKIESVYDKGTNLGVKGLKEYKDVAGTYGNKLKNVTPAELMSLKQGISKDMKSVMALKNPTLRNEYNNLRKLMSESLKDYGKIDKSFGKAYQTAESLYRTAKQKTLLSSTMEKLKNVNPMLKTAMLGGIGYTIGVKPTTAVTGAVASASVMKSYIDILKNPEGRKLFKQLSITIAKNQPNKMVPILKKLSTTFDNQEQVNKLQKNKKPIWSFD